MTRADGSKVERIGQINNTFLTARLLEYIGKIGVARLSNENTTINAVTAQFEVGGPAITDTTYDRLCDFFGKDNLFLADKQNLDDSFKTGAANKVLIQKQMSIGAQSEDARRAANVSATKLDVVKQVFKAMLPEEHKASVDEIMDSPASKAQAARELHDLFVRIGFGADKYFETRAAFEEAFDKRIHDRYIKEPLIVLGLNAPVAPVEYYYGAPGQKTLPEGHAYVNPAHEYEEPINFPVSIEHLPQFRPAAPEPQRYSEYDSGENIGHVYEFGLNDAGLRRMRNRERDASQRIGGHDTAFSDNLRAIRELGCSRAAKVVAACFLGAKVNRKTFDRLIVNNLPFPMNGLLCRPHSAWRGRTGILVQSRGGAGTMYWGHAQCEIEHDAARMIGIVHTVAYMGCLIRNPENVYCQPNMFIDEYLGGFGVIPFTPATYDHMTPGGQRESIICIATPYNENEFPSPMDIAGYYYSDYEMGLLGSNRDTEAHYSTAARYLELYSFLTRTQANDVTNTPTVLPDDTHINRIMWPGTQSLYNRRDGNYSHREDGKGHWGDIVYSGCHGARIGRDQYLDPARVEKCI